MLTFAQIIDKWPKPSPVSLGQDIGVPSGTVRQWRNRNTLPDRVWRAVVEAAGRRGIEGVSLETLAEIADQPKKEAPASGPGAGFQPKAA